MNIDLIEYKNDFLPLIINQLIDYSSFSFDTKIQDENTEYFDFEIYKCLKSPQERLRYFILYDLEKKESLQNLTTNIITDLDSIFNKDTNLLLKTLLKLFYYKVFFIPLNENIKEILYNCLQNDEYTYDARNLNILYLCKFGLIYPEEHLNRLIEYSIKNDNKCRTSIWSFEIRLILFYDILFPYEYIKEIIENFWNFKLLDKYISTRIILSMILSKNEQNKLIIQKIFIEKAEEIKEILSICSEGENISTIATILYLIKDYSNFEYFRDIVDICIEKKHTQNLQIDIPQEIE